MKNISKNIKYISIVGIMMFAFFYSTKYSLAGLIPTPHSMAYEVIPGNVPLITITANPMFGPVNVIKPALTWSVTNSPTSCSASGEWSGNKPVSGNNVIQPVLTTLWAHTYTLTCLNSNGTSSKTVVVTATPSTNLSPVVNAGADQTITQPTQASSLTGTATDSDGTIVSTLWTLTSGPSAVNIVSPNSLSTSVTGMINVGIYTFNLSATDNDGQTTSDTITITVKSGSGPTGTISVTPCASPIPVGGSSCTGSVSWTTGNLTANPTAITRNTGSPTSFAPSPLSSGSKVVILGGGTTNFYLYHNGVLLAQSSANISCTSGSTWNGSICASTSIKPVVTITASPTSGTVNVVNPALTWSGTNSPTSCTASETAPGGATITWSGTKASSGNNVIQGVLTKVGTYTYNLSCKNSAGTGSDSVIVTAKDSNAPSGTLIINPCTILVNASTCTTNINWTTKNLTANPTQITNTGSLTPSFNPSPLASGSKTITLGGGTTNFYLYHQTVSLADVSKSGDCAINSVWNGSICASIPTTFTITADSIPSSEGSITPPGKQTVNNGDNQTYIIQSNTLDPYSSYQISTIVVDGSTAVTLPANTTAYSYPFTNITNDHTISATFSLLPPPPPVDGECKTPALHYQCAVGGSVNNKSNAKSWNWTCAGSPAIPPSATTLGRPAGGDVSCSQTKPIYNEN